MSTLTEVEETLHDWLCGEDCICKTQVNEELPGVSPSSIHSNQLKRKWDLMRVVRGQHEGLFDNGWWDIWCVEDDAHCEVFQGTLEAFGRKLIDLGWDVENVDRNQAICPNCQNAIDQSHYASQFEDERGLLG